MWPLLRCAATLLLDSEGFGLGGIPKLSEAFRLFLMMQDHFADRLGVIVIANTSGPARLFLSLINAFLSESVKKKIHLLPEMERGGREMLSHLIDPRYVPDWLGGTDHYVFDAEAEYAGSMCTRMSPLGDGASTVPTLPDHASKSALPVSFFDDTPTRRALLYSRQRLTSGSGGKNVYQRA